MTNILAQPLPRHSLFVEAEKLRTPNCGLGQYTRNLLLALHAEAPPGWQVVALVPESQRRGVEQEGAKSGRPLQTLALRRVHKKWPGLLLPAMGRLSAKGSKTAWLMGNQLTKYCPPAGLLLGWPAPGSVVMAFHDLNFLHRDDYGPAKKAELLAKVQRRADAASALVCISQAARAEAVANLRLGSRPASVAYNGLPALDAVPGQAPPALAHLAGKRFALCIGMINPMKGFHLAIEALALLGDPGLHLAIAGINDTAYAQGLPALAASLGLGGGAGNESRVHVTGPVSGPEKAWLLAHAAALVHPSLAEGFGLPVIEALASGTPVAASPLPALIEVGAPLAAFSADWAPQSIADTMREALRRGAQPGFAAAAKAHAAKFTWQAAAQGYWQAVQQAAGQ